MLGVARELLMATGGSLLSDQDAEVPYLFTLSHSHIGSRCRPVTDLTSC